jgi:hypothetical protein
MDVIERPEIVDEAVDGNDPYAGVAVLALVLHYPDPCDVLPRIKRALMSSSAQTPR